MVEKYFFNIQSGHFRLESPFFADERHLLAGKVGFFGKTGVSIREKRLFQQEGRFRSRARGDGRWDRAFFDGVSL